MSQAWYKDRNCQALKAGGTVAVVRYASDDRLAWMAFVGRRYRRQLAAQFAGDTLTPARVSNFPHITSPDLSIEDMWTFCAPSNSSPTGGRATPHRRIIQSNNPSKYLLIICIHDQ